ncbi:MAG: hypothetical protein ACRDDH_01365 [Cetobacterium sp.]|uniref:hypothetical protein n=1 Tax=Cetobacterium sp. TaxID=2071632 RepID=UPI003EE7F86E
MEKFLEQMEQEILKIEELTTVKVQENVEDTNRIQKEIDELKSELNTVMNIKEFTSKVEELKSNLKKSSLIKSIELKEIELLESKKVSDLNTNENINKNEEEIERRKGDILKKFKEVENQIEKIVLYPTTKDLGDKFVKKATEVLELKNGWRSSWINSKEEYRNFLNYLELLLKGKVEEKEEITEEFLFNFVVSSIANQKSNSESNVISQIELNENDSDLQELKELYKGIINSDVVDTLDIILDIQNNSLEKLEEESKKIWDEYNCANMELGFTIQAGDFDEVKYINKRLVELSTKVGNVDKKIEQLKKLGDKRKEKLSTQIDKVLEANKMIIDGLDIIIKEKVKKKDFYLPEYVLGKVKYF